LRLALLLFLKYNRKKNL